MKMLFLSYIALFVFSSCCLFAQEVQYQQLISHKLVYLLGKKLQDSEVQELIKELGQRSEMLSGTNLYAYPQKGIKLEFYAGKQLEAIEWYSGKTAQKGELFQAKDLYFGGLPKWVWYIRKPRRGAIRRKLEQWGKTGQRNMLLCKRRCL